MLPTRRALLVLAAAWVAMTLAACSGAPGPEPLRVFAAASLQGTLDTIASRYTARTGQPVSITYAGTPTLARQLLTGAPADVVISADALWMDTLGAAGAIDTGSRFDVAGNRLVVIAPRGAPRRVALTAEALGDALDDGRLAVADTVSVPAGRYARASLAALGLWDTVQGRLAEADDVRGALAFVARGEAPLGIVYATDARAESRVRVVAQLPARTHPPISYPAAGVSRGDRASASRFLAWLAGADARAQFARAGFTSPRSSGSDAR